MQELLWYGLSHGLTRPVPGQDVPLWFAALLIVGLLCAGALIGSGMFQWSRSLHRKRASLLRVRGHQNALKKAAAMRQAEIDSGRRTGGPGAAAA
jgi:hypothetical protein